LAATIALATLMVFALLSAYVANKKIPKDGGKK